MRQRAARARGRNRSLTVAALFVTVPLLHVLYLAALPGCKRAEPPAPTAGEKGAGARVDDGLRARTMEELAAAYVSAVNAHDVSKLKSLLHPKCLSCVDDQSSAYYEELFSRYTSPTIPDDHKVRFEPIPAGEPLPYEDVFRYPLRPTHTFTVEYTEGSEYRGTILNQMVHDGGAWWVMIPCPTPDVLARYRESRRQAAQDARRAEDLVRELKDPLRSELMGMLQEGRRTAAVVRYREATGEPPAVAETVIDRLSQGMGP